MAISRESAHLICQFPNLLNVSFQITSPQTMNYNCVAWAAGDDTRWWEPGRGFYWPEGIPREYTLAAYVAVFLSMGFSESVSAELEQGMQKIALFAKDGVFTHAARQLVDGWWTSKLGDWEDIRHQTLDALSCESWGDVVQILARNDNSINNSLNNPSLTI